MTFASLVAVFLIAFVAASVVVLSVADAYFSVVMVATVVAKPYLVAVRVGSDLTDSRTAHH